LKPVLGDIHGDVSFFDSVVDPFHHASHGNVLKASISDYPRNFAIPEAVASTETLFESEFIAAWLDEGFFPIDDYRHLIDELEDYAIKQNRAVVALIALNCWD
jgi:hypothetical protein